MIAIIVFSKTSLLLPNLFPNLQVKPTLSSVLLHSNFDFGYKVLDKLMIVLLNIVVNNDEVSNELDKNEGNRNDNYAPHFSIFDSSPGTPLV